MATQPQITDPQVPPPDSPESSAEQTAQDNLGEWNELLPDDLKDCIVKLTRQQCDEFKYSRRLEIMQSYKGRSFWREMQHLNWNWGDQNWDVQGPAAVGTGDVPKQQDTAVLYTTNMYQGFGESFIAVITQSTPSVRFEPEDPNEAADIETSTSAEDMRKLVQHENDPIRMMTKAAYYAWTDGRIHGWTRWAMDKRTKTPREMQTVYGVMEVKVPVIYEEMCDYPYLQFSEEYHISTVRDIVRKRAFPPDYYKKIKGGSSGNGQDMYERTARISIKQGISIKSAGGDMYAHLCTIQRTWMRPSVFLDDSVEEQYRDKLVELFPTGCYAEVVNGVYIGSRDATMDDEWVVENVMEGDGGFRNAKGTCMVSVQERANDIINTTQDVYEKTQPASHWDDRMFDLDAMKRQKSIPGARYGVNMDDLGEAGAIASRVFFEPASTVSADMLTYLKELMTDIPEFLTGLSAILFGADEGGDKSGKALSIQQAAAMGRIGLPFRVLKRFYAGMMEQAIRCAVRNRKQDVSVGIPDETGHVETIQVRVGDLTGNIRCFASSDENYPESWTQKRATFLQLMTEAVNDPFLAAIMNNPKNQNLAKRLTGLQELELPDADSWNKQMVEINLLLQEPPPPPVQPPPQQVPNPLVPDIMETIQPPPIQNSSIPIDPDYDNHVAEFLTVTIFLNTAKGQKIKVSNPAGFENVRLHGLEHKKAIQAAMPPPPPEAAGGGSPAKHKAAPPPEKPAEPNPANAAM